MLRSHRLMAAAALALASVASLGIWPGVFSSFSAGPQLNGSARIIASSIIEGRRNLYIEESGAREELSSAWAAIRSLAIFPAESLNAKILMKVKTV